MFLTSAEAHDLAVARAWYALWISGSGFWVSGSEVLCFYLFVNGQGLKVDDRFGFGDSSFLVSG